MRKWYSLQKRYLSNKIQSGFATQKSRVVLEKEILLEIFQCIFCYCVIISLRKWHGPPFKRTWIPFTHGRFVLRLVEIGPVVLEKKILKTFSRHFLYFYYLRLETKVALHLNKLELPAHGMLCAKFGWICFGGIENKYFKFDQCIFVISLSSPLGKSRGPSIEQTWT